MQVNWSTTVSGQSSVCKFKMRRPAEFTSKLPIVLLFGFAWSTAWVEGVEDLSQFLYLNEPPDSVFPINEYKASADGEQPAFLFSPDYPNPRVVEFYAHWCPHCKHFFPKYVEFGRNLRTITDKMAGEILVETFAVSCVPNKDICSQMGIHGYPSLKLFPAHSVNGTEFDRSNLHPSRVFNALGISIEEYSTSKQGKAAGGALAANAKSNVRANSIGTPNHEEPQRKHFMERSKKETFDDAHLSFDFLLRHGVYTAPGALSNQAKYALDHFVSILTKALPASSSLHSISVALSENRNEIVTSEDALVQVLDGLLPPPSTTWSPACVLHGTGYTCGLWTLFHIVTVGTVEWNLLAADHQLTTLDVADSLRNFIEHFFQCDACRAHFLSEYDSCSHDRCNRLTSDQTSSFEEWKELPLWLYETHNGVNARLRQERMANKENEDTTSEWQVQWPPEYDCPKCWLSEGRWDEEQVYQFLRLQYWPEDYKTSDIQHRLSWNGASGDNPNSGVVPMKNKIHAMDDEDSKLEAPQLPLPMMTFVLLSIVSGYTYHRKRKFDLKGYHKKRESDC